MTLREIVIINLEITFLLFMCLYYGTLVAIIYRSILHNTNKVEVIVMLSVTYIAEITYAWFLGKHIVMIAYRMTTLWGIK